jgi:hypothetical protein
MPVRKFNNIKNDSPSSDDDENEKSKNNNNNNKNDAPSESDEDGSPNASTTNQKQHKEKEKSPASNENKKNEKSPKSNNNHESDDDNESGSDEVESIHSDNAKNSPKEQQKQNGKLKKQNFNESDSDLWSEIGIENYRHPNREFPPRLRIESETVDTYTIIENQTRMFGFVCEWPFALCQFVFGLSCCVVGILCMTLFSVDFGGVRESYVDGATWAFLMLLICFFVGFSCIYFAFSQHKILLRFDKEARRVVATKIFLLFGGDQCCTFGAWRRNEELFDVSFDDILRIAIENYTDEFWHRQRSNSLSEKEKFVPVDIVLRYLPDGNAVLLNDNDEDDDERERNGMKNNCIILSSMPIYQALKIVQLWKNYLVLGLGIDEEFVRRMRRNWIQSVGHVDAERVNLRVEQFLKRKKRIEERHKQLKLIRQQNKNDENENNHNDENEEDYISSDDSDEGEEKEENNKKKKQNSSTTAGNNEHNEHDDDDDVGEENKQNHEETEEEQRRRVESETPRTTVKRLKKEKPINISAKQQAKRDQNNKARLALALNRTIHGDNIIPQQHQQEGNKQNSSSSQKKISKSTATAAGHLLTPRTTNAFKTATIRKALGYFSNHQQLFHGIREYAGKISYMSAPILKYGIVIIPLFLLIIIAVIGTILVSTDAVENPYSVSNVGITFFVIFCVLVVIIAFTIYYYHYRFSVKILIDFERKKLFYRVGPKLSLKEEIEMNKKAGFHYDENGVLISMVASRGGNSSSSSLEEILERKRRQKMQQQQQQIQQRIEKKERHDDGNLYEIDFCDIVKVTCGSQPVLLSCCGDFFQTREKSFVLLHFKDPSSSFPMMTSNSSSTAVSIPTSSTSFHHTHLTLNTVPLCNIDDPEKANAFLDGWQELFNIIKHGETGDHDQDTSSSPVRQIPVVTAARAASPAPLPSPSPDRNNNNNSSQRQRQQAGGGGNTPSPVAEDDENNFHNVPGASPQNNTNSSHYANSPSFYHSPSPGGAYHRITTRNHHHEIQQQQNNNNNNHNSNSRVNHAHVYHVRATIDRTLHH